MQRIYLLFFLFLFSLLFTNHQSFAGSFGKDSSELIREACIDILKSTRASVVGKTEQGNSYTLFAIKRGKEWTFVILDSTGYYSVRQNKGKDDIIENSQSSTEMLCFMFKKRLLKIKNKPKNVSGLTLSNYYRFRPSARKTYRSAVKIQNNVRYLNNTLKSPGGAGKVLKRALR